MRSSAGIVMASAALLVGGFVVAQPYLDMSTGEMLPATTLEGPDSGPRWKVFSYIPESSDAPVVMRGRGVMHAIIPAPEGRNPDIRIYIGGLRGQGGPMALTVPIHYFTTTNGVSCGLGSEPIILDAQFEGSVVISGDVAWDADQSIWVQIDEPPAFTILWKSEPDHTDSDG